MASIGIDPKWLKTTFGALFVVAPQSSIDGY